MDFYEFPPEGWRAPFQGPLTENAELWHTL